ncbi:HNH endonuclease [Candidatus Poribacteria bacterium]|nr:HNH endonuclease [Candidatus Poribacteria bacterium]
MAKTIKEFIMEFFMNNANKEFKPCDVDKWVTAQREKAGKPAEDVQRDLRELGLTGRLFKPRRGIYMYVPDQDNERKLQDFPQAAKLEILKKYNYRCAVCGQGKEDGVEIAVDHKIPREKGGTNDIENGQILCTRHNNLKKTYSQTEAGKRFFIEIYSTAVANDDQPMIAFCQSVFDAYDEHYVNGHIERPDK